MNKKTKRITVGLVSALCLLLVVALGFGVTGAWYRARRQATGVVELDQGIKLIVNNLNENTAPAGEGTGLTQSNQLDGSFWVATGTGDERVALQEGETVSSTNPGTLTKDVIVPTIQANTGSTPFYAKAKLDITFKAYNGDRSDVTTAVYTLADLKKSDGSPVGMTDIFTDELTFANTWKANGTGAYVYVNTGATSADAAEIAPGASAPSGEIAILTAAAEKVGNYDVDKVTLKDWTNGAEWVEFGGPIFYVVNPAYSAEAAAAATQEAPYTVPQYLSIEIAKINFKIYIQVIQSTNLTPEAKNTFVTTDVDVA